jgi:competence protein ComEC
MLIDGGGRLEYRSNDDDNESFVPDIPGIGEAVVSPVLWNKGYSRIDHIVATHADADHIQGLADIAENFQVGEALFGRTPLDDPGFAQLAGVLANHNIKIETISRGRILKFGGAVVEVLYPAADPTGQAPSDNDHSVVVRIVYGSRAFLLTGDIEQGAENELVNGRGVLRADIIKVAHHGSRTSSTQEFINAVDPQYAVISVGRRSRFGHPHKEVVDRWLASGSNVMTTGERGMISVSTDGKDLMVHPFLSQ